MRPHSLDQLEAHDLDGSGAVQQGIALTSVKVRVPSKFWLFLGSLSAGVVGAVGAGTGAEALRRMTRLSPAQRAVLVASVGVLGGALVGRNSPRAGAGVALGAVGAAVPSAWEAIELWLSTRDMAQGPTQQAQQGASSTTTGANPTPGAQGPSSGLLDPSGGAMLLPDGGIIQTVPGTREPLMLQLPDNSSICVA